MTMSDKMVVMEGGTIAQVGSPHEVYAAPETTFVASFVGSPRMNLIDGRVASGVFESPWGRVPIDVPDQAGVLGVRPELVVLGSAGTSGASARIELIEQLGPRAIVSLTSGHGRLTSVVEASALGGVKEGKDVAVSFSPHGLHLFDAERCQRLLTT